jgi:hypothetical protein
VKAKAVIIATAGGGQLWNIDMEHGGYSTMYNRTKTATAPRWHGKQALP